MILNNPYSSHNYKIRVSTWSGAPRAASACSPKFEIRGRDRPEYITPSPTSIPHTGVSQQDPRTDGEFMWLASLYNTCLGRSPLLYITRERSCNEIDLLRM